MRLSPLRALQSAILLLALLTPTITHAQDITTGLVGHWKLDETSGTVASDSTGNHNGTMGGSLSGSNNATSGKRLGALNFDGVDDNIEIPYSSDLDLNNFTIAFWVNSNQAPNTGAIRQIIAKNESYNFAWDHVSSSFVQTLHFRSSGTWYRAQILQTLSADTWYHIVGTYDGVNLKVFVNGVEDNSTATGGVLPAANTRNLYIGSATNGGSFFDGKVDDVRIYNRALTPSDIETLYEYSPGALRYNDESEAVEYHDGGDWVHTGLGSYSPNGVEFEAVTPTYLNTASATATADSKRGLVSMWFKLNDDQGTPQHLYTNEGEHFDINYDGASNELKILGLNDTGTTILDMRTTGLNGNISSWHHLLASWDLSDPAKRHLYLDGSSDLSISTYTDDIIDFTRSAESIGADTTGSNPCRCNMADLYVETGTYIDLSVSTNRQKFISDSGLPMYLGTDGTLPLGKSPDIFLSGATDAWHTNKGTGGGFTESGVLSDAGNQPGEPDLDIGLSSGLVAHWKLDETSGTVIADSTGNGNTGTASPGIPTIDSLPGKVGNSMNFNAPEYIDVGQMSAMIGQNAFTMAFWMRLDVIPTAPNDNDAPIMQHDDFDNQYGCRFDGNNQAFSCYLENGGVTHSAGVYNSGNITTGTWYHVVFTYDGSSGTSAQVRLYMNGSVRNTRNYTSALTIPNLSNTMRIASLNGAGSAYIDGRMDDVRVYNRALSPLEVSALYGGGCDDPTNIKGSIIYNDDDKVMQYCNGTEWVAMGPVGGTGGAGCSAPTGNAGDLMYNEDYTTLQYCNDEDWVAVGHTANDFYNVGLEAHWTLNETSGGIIADSSGNGRSGTWRDNVNDDVTEETIAGKVSTAIEYDGIDDRIFMGTDPGLLEGQSEGSVCLWMNYTGSITRDFAMVAKFNASTSSTDGIYMFIDETAIFSGATNTVTFAVQVQGLENGRVEGTSSLVTSDVWDHYCGTFKGNTFIRLYKNGVLNAENTTSIVSNFATMPALHFRVGNEESVSRGFKGSLDEVRVYHRALTSGEVAALYNATK